MAQYKSFEKNIEVGGTEIPAIAFGALGELKRKELKEKYNLSIEAGAWNDLQSLLSCLEEIEKTLGKMNIFLIGKGATEKVQFPPMDSLKQALESIDVAYHMTHKKDGKIMFDETTGTLTEGIGNYRLTKFDEVAKKAEMVCETPYPAKLEEGIITQIVRMYKPKASLLTNVELDTTKENKDVEGNSCTFKISW